MAAAYRFTRFGLETRAAAETEKGAFVSGIAPDRVAAANWMISAAIAGISGVLIAPIVPPTPVGYTLFIVPALAAAVLGQFQYIVPAVLAGLAIGMLQSELTYFRGQHTWLPSAGLAELVPLVLILIVLVVRAKPLPSRGVVILQTLGRAPRPQSLGRPAVLGTAAAVVLLFLLQGEWRTALITSMMLAIVSLSLVVVTGYAGQISLAQLTLAGVAGFILGPLTTDSTCPSRSPRCSRPWERRWSVWSSCCPPCESAASRWPSSPCRWAWRSRRCGSATPSTSAPAARTSMARRCSASTSGPRSAPTSPASSSGSWSWSCSSAWRSGVARLRRSTLGSEMLAVRANERSAAGAGIDVVRVKLISFAIGSFIAGLGGSLIAYFQGNVTFDAFTTFVGLGVFATAYIGGITSVSGGLVAGLLAAGGLNAKAADLLPDLGKWYAVISGIGLILTIVLNPEGIVGPIHAKLARPAGQGRRLRRPRPSRQRCTSNRWSRCAGGEVVAVDQRRPRRLRRCGGRRRCRPRGPPGHDRRAHRPQRRRQDHLARRHERLHAVHGTVTLRAAT